MRTEFKVNDKVEVPGGVVGVVTGFTREKVRVGEGEKATEQEVDLVVVDLRGPVAKVPYDRLKLVEAAKLEKGSSTAAQPAVDL